MADTNRNGSFPNYAQYGRDEKCYPKKERELLSTGGYVSGLGEDVDEIIEKVVDILKADGAFEDIIVNEEAIANKVIATLKEQGIGKVDEDKLQKDTAKAVVDALKADTEFINSLKGKDGTAPTATEVANALKADDSFKESVKGKDGVSPTAAAVAKSLKDDVAFVESIKGKDGTAPTATEVADVLKADTEFIESVKPDALAAEDVIDSMGDMEIVIQGSL